MRTIWEPERGVCRRWADARAGLCASFELTADLAGERDARNDEQEWG